MNAYDFDKTIFYPDSSYCFIRYCIRHYPAAVLKNSGRAAAASMRYLLGKAKIEELKEALFAFMRYLPGGGEQAAEQFWNKNYPRIQQWYLQKKREDDIIISASPEFMLEPVRRRLGVRLIATRMDPFTGRITGKNCHDSEKVLRLHEQYGNIDVEEFYSDSFADTPMAELAQKAYMVNKGTVGPWPVNNNA